MRLIDADALLQKQYRIDDSATLSTRDVVNVEDIEDAPTVCDIYAIRAEIEKIMSIDLDMNSEHSKVEARSMAIVLEIIDKYMKGESNG